MQDDAGPVRATEEPFASGSRPADLASGSASMPTIVEIIDDAPIGRLQVLVFALCILVSLIDGFDTQSIAFVAPAIAKQWGVSQWHFGFLFSATLLGSAIGNAVFGILADRVGRRRLVIVTTLIFGLFSAASAVSTGYWQLLAFRLLGGIGMGGVIPNMLALAAEYAPLRRRATIVTFTLWGFPFGAVAGGIAAGPMIMRWGWPSVFWLGAAAPVLLVPVLIAALPESLRFLGLDAVRRNDVVTLLRRIDPARAAIARMESRATAPGKQRGQVSALFGSGLAAPTILLSTVMFLSLFLTYLLINWVPTMLSQAGMSVSNAILGAVALNLGGILGSYILSRAIDGRGRPPLMLAGGYACAAIAIWFASEGSTNKWPALGLLLMCGFFHIGTQLSTTAFTSGVYPVAIRGTGIGVIQAVGRIGSLMGPIVGGALLSMGMTARGILELAVIPACLASLSLLALASRRRGAER